MNKPIAIAIDGPAGAGKSSVAQAVARSLGLTYLDTGAMYRATALYMLRTGIDLADTAAIAAGCPQAEVDVVYLHNQQHVLLNGEDVTALIRSPEVSAGASAVAVVPQVRTQLVERQRAIAAQRGVVMDGRDIGTKVLPQATLKIFLTATAQERARRRFIEMQAKGAPDTFEQVLADLQARDHQDSTRAASPLQKAEDAFEVDSTGLTAEQVAEFIVKMAQERGASE